MNAPITTAAPAGFVREIDSSHANARDWDHEGDLDSLQAECRADREDIGCLGHEYLCHDRGRFMVWRVWEDAGRRGSVFNRPLPVSVSAAMENRMMAASFALHLKPADLARVGIQMALTEYEATGRLQAPPSPTGRPETPALQLARQTRERCAELDKALGVADGEGIAETLLSSMLRDLAAGDLGLLDGWDWRSPRQVKAVVREMATRWRAEDAAKIEEEGGLRS